MTYFGKNIKFLRKRRGRTQDDVAFTLSMKRPTLSGYENGVAEPGMDALIAFSRYFGIAIDTLLKVDLTTMRESELMQLERGDDIYINGSKLRVLATTVDSGNNDNIELVNENAKAGYRSGYADPEYIRVLPAFHLPFLDKGKKYRTFQVSGDSMLPIPDKSYVTGEYMQDWDRMRDFYPYIILTREDGIVFKLIENRLKEERKVVLHSLNAFYEPYELPANAIKEVWKYVHYISSELPEPNLPKDELVETVRDLQKKVRAIQTKLNI